METASFLGPGFSFDVGGGSAHGSLDDFFDSAPHRDRSGVGDSGLLGTAFGLLDELMSSVPSRRQPHQIYVDEVSSRDDNDDDDYDANDDDQEDLAFGDYDHSGRSRSIFTRFKNKLFDNRQRDTEASYNRDASPSQEPRRSRRQSSYRAEVREPSWAQPNSFQHVNSGNGEFARFNDRAQRARPSRRTSNEVNLVQALERAVKYHQREIKRCKNELHAASREQRVSSDYLQGLVEALKRHESAYAHALHDLDLAEDNVKSTQPPRQAPRQPQPDTSRRRRNPSRTAQGEYGYASGVPFAFSAHSTASHPMFTEAADFDFGPGNVFGAFGHPFHHFVHTTSFYDDFDHIFAMPSARFTNAQRKRPRFSTSDSSAHFPHQAPYYDTSTPSPPKPPPTLLTHREAKKLYETYNNRFLALLPTDPNVPYPARGLQASALTDRDSLWAPLVTAHASTWSEETVMQANAQAFFLGAIDLVPQYTEAPGTSKIQMGFDKSRASPAQVQQLVDLLKKEKVRWHSDRLGRRNGGSSGPNEMLQRDERARAVFHAVCELMEVAQ